MDLRTLRSAPQQRKHTKKLFLASIIIVVAVAIEVIEVVCVIVVQVVDMVWRLVIKILLIVLIVVIVIIIAMIFEKAVDEIVTSSSGGHSYAPQEEFFSFTFIHIPAFA